MLLDSVVNQTCRLYMNGNLKVRLQSLEIGDENFGSNFPPFLRINHVLDVYVNVEIKFLVAIDLNSLYFQIAHF